MSAPLTRTDYIAQQLRAVAPDAEWNMTGHDRAMDLARILERNGIYNLGLLQLVQVTIRQTVSPWEPDYVTTGLALRYQGRNFGFLGTPDRVETLPILENDLGMGYKIAWSAVGHGNCSYIVRRSPVAGLQIVPYWASSSDAADIREFVLTTASIALSVVMPATGIQAGAALGRTIVTASFAAAYPGVTAAIGNIAIATAMNGGNVGAAVAGAVIGYGSGVVGQTVGLAADSVVAGRVAASATSALLRGGDVQNAVGATLLQYGMTEGAMSLFDWVGNWGDSGSQGGGDFTFGPGGSYTPPIDYIDPISGQPLLPSIFDNPDWGNWWENPDFGWQFGFNFDPSVVYSPGTLLPSYQAPGWTPTGANPPPSPALPAPTPAPSPAPVAPVPPASTFNPAQLIQQISGAAMAALSLVRAYRDALNPRPVTTARTVGANGAVTAASSNGMIQTRNPNGTISSTLPAVGVPQATVDGNLIVNNGDGTYTLIYADGRTEVRRYAAGAGSDPFASIPGGLPVVGIAAAGVLFLVLSRKR